MVQEIPYGTSFLELDIRHKNVTVCAATEMQYLQDGGAVIRNALDHPIASEKLSVLAKDKKNVCIVINDVTRPTPSKFILEGILEDLSSAGIQDEQITILVANGNHRATTHEELLKILGGEIVNRLDIVNHVAANDEDLIHLGETSMGVPIHVNKHLVNSEFRILTGTIRPHQSAGFSGGRKSVLPGVAGLESIMKHHSFPIFPLSPQLGKYKGNPFHEQALEGARLVGIDFIINVIENFHGEIMDAVAGDLEDAHVAGIEKCKSIWMYKLPRKADIVITSPGGFPKDINLHQSQKALAPCELIVKKGGVIILTAQCPDGAGRVPEWFQGVKSPFEVIERFKEFGWSPQVNAKPFLLARPLSNSNVIVVCDGISEETLKSMFMIPAKSIEEAYQKALKLCGVQEPEIVILPCAGDVIPQVGSKD